MKTFFCKNCLACRYEGWCDANEHYLCEHCYNALDDKSAFSKWTFTDSKTVQTVIKTVPPVTKRRVKSKVKIEELPEGTL